MSYRVQTQQFSGPFDLLLSLVYKQKVYIASLDIADIAAQYIREIQKLTTIDLDVASDFVLVAATLLQIKAKQLVADSETVPADDEDKQDEYMTAQQAQELLVARLITYKQFLEASSWLQDAHEKSLRRHPNCGHVHIANFNTSASYLEGTTLRTLAVCCADLLSRREDELIQSHHIAAKRRPIALTCARIDAITRAKLHISFSQLLGSAYSKQDVVEHFLAMLELIAGGYLDAVQSTTFGDIELTRTAATRSVCYKPLSHEGEH
ncbi:ScpA/B protein [Fannyhessea vaginae PB189-T1-4]|uniref:Segregation and condensation protein A n=1 Tax=Fannyhessea vaginae PB189-T1-4 TaxID=866774 RepID=A0ABP2J3L9_9ACTN|nr:segregation/condensation protein A [Fannyhessea vaginae]EFL44701.1 ScpA/B protein [Fannyhessea vaginae PB189-T1-4]